MPDRTPEGAETLGKESKTPLAFGVLKKRTAPMQLHPEYARLMEGFASYLRTVGYARRTCKILPAAVRDMLLHLQQEGISRIDEIEQSQLEAYCHYLLIRPNKKKAGALSRHTVRNHIFGLRLFFAYAQKMAFITENPMSLIRAPRPEGKPRQVLSPAEIEALYRACRNEQERAILGLFYGCGLRRMEAEKLDLRDVDFREKYLYVRSGKGRKRRVIPMAEYVVNDLKSYRYDMRPGQVSRFTKQEDARAFMLNKRGGRLRGAICWGYFKAVARRAKLDEKISLHHLRHSIATHLLRRGMRVEEVRDFLGHQFLETTQIYTRINANQLKL